MPAKNFWQEVKIESCKYSWWNVNIHKICKRGKTFLRIQALNLYYDPRKNIKIFNEIFRSLWGRWNVVVSKWRIKTMVSHLFDTNLLPRKEDLINRIVLKYWLFCSCAFWRNARQKCAFCIMILLFEKQCYGQKSWFLTSIVLSLFHSG
jgi:hypothetical protein